MQEEMFEELWKNGQMVIARRKAEGDPVPHGRTRHLVKYAFEKIVLPEHVHWGGVMRFPADRIIRGEEIQAVVANSVRLPVRTQESDVHEEHALLSGLRSLIEAQAKPVTLFPYIPPLPMAISGDGGWRGWLMRYAVRAGHGWKLAPEGV